jgi:hypothetical protein
MNDALTDMNLDASKIIELEALEFASQSITRLNQDLTECFEVLRLTFLSKINASKDNEKHCGVLITKKDVQKAKQESQNTMQQFVIQSKLCTKDSVVDVVKCGLVFPLLNTL